MASTDYVGQVQARMESLADGFMARAISLAQADMAVLDEQLEHARKKLRGEKGALVTASSALAPPTRAPLATITEASNSPRVEAAAAKPAPRAPPAAAAAARPSPPTNESDSVAKARALVESYTFKELQRELKSRELRAAGKKQELKARLEGALVAELEAAKEGLELEHEADRMHCEGFAMSIFEKADRADRAGAASLGTAKAFYASSVFMEVCRQFGELDADLEAKQKYAVWKASDIRKALKRGERPAPGPPGGEAAAAQEAAPGPPEGPGPAGGLEAEKPGVGEHQLRGAGEEPFPAPPSARAAAPEQRSDPAEALEVDELGLPKAPLQGAPLSPSVGIDVEQFTLPTMPRAADESAASYGPQGGQNAAPGEMEDHSRASGPPSTDPAGAAGAPPSTAPPPSAPPAPAPFAPLAFSASGLSTVVPSGKSAKRCSSRAWTTPTSGQGQPPNPVC